MSRIEQLWAANEVPVDNALHFADGWSYDVSVDTGTAGGMVVRGAFDLEERLALAPNWVSVVDGRKLALEGGGALWHGDGDNGSEGFFAREDAHQSPSWVVFLTNTNPFTRAELSGNTATFRSTSGVVITVDIDDPTRPQPGG